MVTHANYHQTLRDTAHAYANAAWPIFPLRPGTKRPATPNHTATNCNGTDPRCSWHGHTGWEQRATTNHGRIDRAWDQHPYGIGIACGPAGLLVVDLDTPTAGGPSGAEALRSVEDEHGQELPATFTIATPSGGRHLYYNAPPGVTLGNTASRIGPRIDTRAAGGYVVAPPTRTAAGSYQIIDDHPPAALPAWFGELLRALTQTSASGPRQTGRRTRAPGPLRRESGQRISRYVAAAIAGEERRIAAAAIGQRNHTLFCASVAVGQLVGAQVLDQAEAEQLLHNAAGGHLAAGAYDTAQAHQTIASGLRRGITEPRQLPTTTRKTA